MAASSISCSSLDSSSFSTISSMAPFSISSLDSSSSTASSSSSSSSSSPTPSPSSSSLASSPSSLGSFSSTSSSLASSSSSSSLDSSSSPTSSSSSSSSLTTSISSMDSSSSSSLTSSISSMDSSSSLASSISSSSDWKYDVFLSFRGEDTRNNFTGHLYRALDQKAIETFKDDKKLRTGEEISPTLVTAIQRSRCSIIVLSENYASSKWCLEELVVILECRRTKNQKVVPIFYNVDPSHVRNQSGSFEEALAKHEENLKIKVEKVPKWREALTQVANLSGLHSEKNKPEDQLIVEIIADISKDLHNEPSKDAQNLVGVDSCIRELESLLCLLSTDVRKVGIWGMGGIGKSTLARAIYDRISGDFEGCCFLSNVERLASKGDDYLRKELLSGLLRDKNIDVTITSVKARFHSKKVLIVIDNVNHQSILKTLVGELDWFGPQSRIIITTRDKHVLTMHGVNDIYEVKKLQKDKAIELFSHHAFMNDPPTADVMELSQRIIDYAQGLPLALEVLGSSLCKKSKDEWECALKKLEKIPKKEIHEVLQTSFDELDNDEKNIFLDIAIFFNKLDRALTIEMLNSFGFSAVSGIRTLIDKSLISILDDELHMHDLLVEMGKEIARQTSKDPGKRNRLWEQHDIRHVLEKNMGTDEVEVILLNLSGLKEICFTTEAFAKMSKLRLLAILEYSLSDESDDSDDSDSECSYRQSQRKVHISDDFKFHCDELRLLIWEEYPLKSLPPDFTSQNIVVLVMPKSHLTQLWEGKKVFENLKYIDLTDSKYLAETPDFSGVTNLKRLSFEGCTQFSKIHSSLGDLSKLTELNLESCINLVHFPGICQLVSLETLILSGCTKLEKFPDISQHMPCLSKLYLDGTAITELPSSIAYATKLVLLDLQNCERLLALPSSICKLAHLETLSLSGCSRLGKPRVNSDNLDALPRILDRLSNLRKLKLENCWSLRALPPLPSSMQLINASDNCTSLEYISPQSVFVCFGGSIFGNCFQLTKYQRKMEPHLRRMATHFDQDRWKSTYNQQYPNVQVPFSTVFPGSTIPDWFMHYSKGHEVDIDVDPDWYDSNFLGFALSAVIAPKDGSITKGWSTYCNLDLHDLNSEYESESSCVCSFTDAHTRQLEDTTINSDHLWLAYVPSFFGFNGKKWNRIKFSFSTSGKSCIVKHWGVCPLYIESSSDGDYSSGRYRLNDGLGVQTSNDNIDDEGNASGSVLDDLREWGLEDIIIRRSPEEGQSSGQVHANVKGTHAWNQERLWMQPNPLMPESSNAQYTHERNPAESVLDYQYESAFEDGIVSMRSLLEEYPRVIGYSPTDSHARDQERLVRQPNLPISRSETGFWICITIFGFIFLAHIFHSASFRISPLLGVLLLLFIFSRL